MTDTHTGRGAASAFAATPGAFQQRVIDEKTALDGNITRLACFIGTPTYAALEPKEQCRLRAQLWYMRRYADVLGERIAAF